jgi:hypothetical protein
VARSVRLGAGSGLLGDRLDPALELIAHGDLDYLSFDVLGEITIADLLRRRALDETRGFADVLRQVRQVLPAAIARGVRLVTNAGGVNPSAALERSVAAASALGLSGRRIAATVGPDCAGAAAVAHLARLRADGVSLAHLDTGEPFEEIASRAIGVSYYLGSRPVAEALATGAACVITGRHTDHALWLAPLQYELGWADDAWDLLAAGTVVAHLLECSTQLTGGNFTDWEDVPGLERLGNPLAEVWPDGTAVVTKTPQSGGCVTLATCKEQLIYEIGDPTRYTTPDVVADFTSVRLVDDGPDRVRVSGARGSPPPDTLKALVAYRDGWLAEGYVSFAWPRAAAKARRTAEIIQARLRDAPGIAALRCDLLGVNALLGPLAPPVDGDLPEVTLRVVARGESEAAVSRLLQEFYPLYVAGPPGATGIVLQPAREAIAVWPTLVPRAAVTCHVEVREVE